MTVKSANLTTIAFGKFVNMSSYASALRFAIPILGLNGIFVGALTVRTRLVYIRPSQREDENDWFLQNIVCPSMLVFSHPKVSDEVRDAKVQRFLDLQRNFSENCVQFAIVALGYAAVVASPTEAAAKAVRIFAISRSVHNVLFVLFPYQPFRATAWLSQVGALGFIVYEMLTGAV
eukprot:Clim_evm46s198 gene=Clim_evmTU46s198